MKPYFVLLLLLLCQCTASLFVESVPAGATIHVNGQSTGRTTPAKMPVSELQSFGDPSGFRVQVFLDGHAPSEERSAFVQVSAARIVISLLLPPLLLINIPRGFKSISPERLRFVLTRE